MMRLPASFVAFCVLGCLAGPAAAQDAAPDRRSPVKESLLFLAGFSTGLFLHEAAHLVTGAAVGARPRIDRLSIPLPFIVVHYDPVSRRREFAVASAGFWAQHLVNEALLTAQPELRRTPAPFRKGLFAFGVGTSVFYAIGAASGRGPERDTRSIADSLGANGVPEPVAGLVIAAPAVLDLYRYYRPGSTWARWTSRALKALSVGLVFAAGK